MRHCAAREFRVVKPFWFVLVGSVFLQSDHQMDGTYGKSDGMPIRQTVELLVD